MSPPVVITSPIAAVDLYINAGSPRADALGRGYPVQERWARDVRLRLGRVPICFDFRGLVQ